MALKFIFQIELIDLDSGEPKLASSDEVDLGIDSAENSLTEYPRDAGEEGGNAIWFEEPGTIVVRKMRGSLWNIGDFYFIGGNLNYDVKIKYLYEPSYYFHGRFFAASDGTWEWVTIWHGEIGHRGNLILKR